MQHIQSTTETIKKQKKLLRELIPDEFIEHKKKVMENVYLYWNAHEVTDELIKIKSEAKKKHEIVVLWPWKS